LFWEAIPIENKGAIIDSILFAFEQNNSSRQLEDFETLIALDKDLVISAIESHINETSLENKKILNDFLSQYK